MRATIIGFVALIFLSQGPVAAQVVPDDAADISAPHPSFASGAGPIVAVDSAHHNYHTADNRYRQFADLLKNDGFRVVDSKMPFNAASLASTNILVIANALPASDGKPNPNPTPSAFSPAEIGAVKQWVAAGGSLLMIADHRPFADGIAALAKAFEFRLQDGLTEPAQPDPNSANKGDIFRVIDGSLRNDVITRGRNPSEQIDSLATFTGSAFQGPPDARPIIVFPRGFWIFDCGLPCRGDVSKQDATGYWQGAVRVVGKGRVAMFAEAGMFSAQIITDIDPPFRFGFNAPSAKQNKQFILNLVRWLAGLLPAA